MLKVSVIIPIYNVSEYIEQCLVSVFTQSYPHLQVILVDDCGTDNSMQIAQEVVAKYPEHEVVVISQPHNMGQSVGRNVATFRADGEYILYLDSDDYLPTDAIEKLLAASDDGTTEVILGDYTTIDCLVGQNFYTSTIDTARFEMVFPSGVTSNIDYWPVTQVAPWNKLIKRSLIIDHDLRFTEGVIYEDLFWCLKLLFVAKRIEYLRSSTYVYRLRQNSTMTSVVKPHNIESYIRFLDDAERFLQEHSSQIKPENYKWLLTSIDSRRIMALKQLAKLKNVSITQKMRYFAQIKPRGRKAELRSLSLPRYSRFVGYALQLSNPLAVWYLLILKTLKR